MKTYAVRNARSTSDWSVILVIIYYWIVVSVFVVCIWVDLVYDLYYLIILKRFFTVYTSFSHEKSFLKSGNNHCYYKTQRELQSAKSNNPTAKMDYTSITKKFEGRKPNLGGLTLNLVAKDDARFVEVVPVEYIAYGVRAMPFLHAWFALDYYKNYCNQSADADSNSELARRLEVVYQLSRIRNHRIK